MNKDKYVKLVIRKLKCSRKKKFEIRRELESDIQIAIEKGEAWEEIYDRLGSPFSMAAEFNDSLPREELKSYKKRKWIKVISIIVIIIVLLGIGISFLLPRTYDIEQSKIFSEAKVIDEAEAIILLLNNDDYNTINSLYSDAKMKETMNEITISAAKEQIGAQWGEFKSFTSTYSGEIKQMGKRYAVIQITALYENRSVTYTISFNEEMKLAGLYMK